MRKLRTAIRMAATVAAIALAPAAVGAPCAGFADLDDSSGFCNNVQWMVNRSITLGCTTSTYCPYNPVNRLQMAIFLTRLGINTATPTFLESVGGSTGLMLAATPVVCTLPGHTAASPQTARGRATFSARSLVLADIAAQFVESIDNGATWTPVSINQSLSSELDRYEALAVLLPPRALDVGASYRYGLRVSRAAGSATIGNPDDYACRIKLYVENRNPLTPPFDE